MRTIYPRRLNKGFTSKFLERYPDRKVSDKRPKHCDHRNKKDADVKSTVNNVNNTVI